MPSWNRIKTLDDVPDEIDVKVNYYRESDHSDLMKAFEGSMDKLPAAEGTIIKISKSEFLAYWLFEDKNPDDLISSGFDALADSAEDALPDLKRYFEVSGHDLRAKAWPEGAERAGDISTRLGVTIGLCVANKILSFTRADWEKIGKTQAANGKEESRLDYNLAATPVGFVAVENKGSITEDNSKKCPSVSKHKSGIIKKKEDNRKKGGIGVLVGTIAVADSTDASKLQCWLLDPPDIFPDDISPNDFRMARRLRFQGRLTQLIFPSSPTLHRVIEQRARQIATEGSRPFEGEGLRYPSGKLIELKWGEKRKPYVRTEGGLWVGRLTRLREGRLLFAGLNQKWIDLVLDQDLELLANFQGKSASRRSLLKWDATSDEVRMLAGFEFLRGNIKDGRFPVSVPIELHETSGGFAFAVVERKKIKFRKKK